MDKSKGLTFLYREKSETDQVGMEGEKGRELKKEKSEKKGTLKEKS